MGLKHIPGRSRRDLRLTLARMAHDTIKQYDSIEGGRVKVGRTYPYTSYTPEANSQQFVVKIGERDFIVSVEEYEG